ncbi:MAG: amino acid decarboxylase [Lachnospiraceae bacterium]|nr:amino acid decarboxylase [Lachnospiraceae bacterium]
METPVYDFVTEYCRQGMSRLHMPGHKGREFLGCEARDITEISGADVLYQAEGILRESQENAARLFHSGRTLYSTEGSSLCIKSMLMALQQGAGAAGRPYILAARNVHRAMIDACALLDLDIVFLTDWESGHLCTSMPEPTQLSRILGQADRMPVGVYLTSPDYLGGMADIPGLASVCESYDIPLVVDHAHGAYLGFLDPPVHPIRLGAAMCCDSAHKTLPVLTGGAYLHIASAWQDRYAEYASRAMAVFGSTSPSYLILQSLDLCNRYLADHYQERLQAAVHQMEQIRKTLRQSGVPVLDTEPLKIVIHAAAAGYSGIEIAQEMRCYGMECEYADPQYVVLMYTAENTEKDNARIQRWGMETILRNRKEPVVYPKISFGQVERECTIRQAVFGPQESIPVEEAEGRVCASECVACPPAVPIAVSGERITREMVHLFRRYGIKEVMVRCL